MALTLQASGTQTATVTTEHDLTTFTGSAVIALEVDMSAMVAGDVVEIRCYGKTLTGGTERLESVEVFYGEQLAALGTGGSGGDKKIFGPFMSDISTRFTLKQTFGTGRAFPWKVLSP